MRQISLREYEPSEHRLSTDERSTLQLLNAGKEKLSLDIQQVIGNDDTYRLTPGSVVGAVDVGNLSLLIKPKIGIGQLLSLACYVYEKDIVRFLQQFEFRENEALPDILARALIMAARRAFARGLLHGYLRKEEALYTVRGRIRFDAQLRRRFSIPLPVEVRYNEFTEDIPANQLVKAAAYRLGGMGLRSTQARSGLAWVAGMLGKVSWKEFPANAVPEVEFDRLNEHYRGVVALSRLILRHSAFEAQRGEVRANGFLMDMNQVFQEFVTVALREALGASERTFGEKWVGYLDDGKQIRLRPDLTWWEGNRCWFVGDVKYKKLEGRKGGEKEEPGKPPNDDMYQLLAYVTAANLPGGMLIYAQWEGEAGTVKYTVRHCGKVLRVAALDLSGSLEEVLGRVKELAKEIKSLRKEGEARRRAA